MSGQISNHLVHLFFGQIVFLIYINILPISDICIEVLYCCYNISIYISQSKVLKKYHIGMLSALKTSQIIPTLVFLQLYGMWEVRLLASQYKSVPSVNSTPQ